MTSCTPEWLTDYTGPLLIDTHVLLWAFLEPDKLSPLARRILEEGAHPIHFSTVTAWEILLKRRKNQLPFRDLLTGQMPQMHVELLKSRR